MLLSDYIDLLNEIQNNNIKNNDVNDMSVIEDDLNSNTHVLTIQEDNNWNLYISCIELGIKAQFNSRNFLNDLGSNRVKPNQYIENYDYGGLSILFENDGFINYGNNITVYSNEIYNWVFNDFLEIGIELDDIINIFGDGKYNNISGENYLSYDIDDNGNSTSPGQSVAHLYIYYNEKMLVTKYSLYAFKIVPLLSNSDYISIYKIETSEPNNENGVGVSITFSNDNEKAIKYIYFFVTPYNAVNDIVYSEIGGISTIETQMTGPIEKTILYIKQGFVTTNADNVWYNPNIKYAIINSIKIVYMDNEEVVLNTFY